MADPSIPDRAEIRSYRDYRRLIRNQTSKSLHNLYDAAYFEKHVGSKELAETYFDSKGLAPTPFTERPLALAGLRPGDRVLDVGCGRGEIVFQSAARGATAVGVDYSQAALEIARTTREAHDAELRARTEFVHADASALPFAAKSFDRAFLLDVVEHLAPHELRAVLGEVRRVLTPEGLLVVHTSPNLWTRTYGYWLVRAVNAVARRPAPPHPVVAAYGELGADPDYDPNKILLHINEQSVLSLKLALLRSGFRATVWLGDSGNLFAGATGRRGAILRRLYGVLGLKLLFGSDIYAVARPR